MARSFNLTANLVLAGPTNLRPIVNSIKTALNNISANVDVKINPTVQQDIKNLDRAFKNFNTTLKNTSTVARDAANALRDLDRAVRGVSLKGLNQQMSQASQAAKNVAAASQDAADGMEKFGHVAGLAVRRFAGFALATGVIMGFLGAIKKATSEALSFQDSMVKIAQLTDTNVSGAFQQFGRQITELSTKWGVASNKLADLQRKLVQTGLKAGEMKQVLDALAKTMLAPAFENVDQTLEGTIAMMSQFKIPASEVEKALSSMNVVAAKFAVESQDLITAIRISGGAFATMSRGVSEGRDALNEFMAIFTSVRGSTRESAESIATGLRTIFTRLERPESIFMLKQLGVELLDLEGKFIGPYKAIEKISAAMEKMDPRDTRFAQIAETLGGYRQIGKVLPLLANAEMRIKALQEAKAGETQLTEDATKAQESWNVQLTKTHERFLALIRDITQTDAFKGMMNVILGLANSLIKLGETIKPILPFLGIMAGIKLMGATRSGLSGFFGGIKGKMAGGGMVPGSGSGDTFPAMLEPGEFVIRKNAVKALGAHNLAKINKMHHGGETSRPVIGQVLSLEDVGTKKASNFLAAGLQTATVSNEIRKELIGYIDKAANGMSLGLAKKIGKKLNLPVADVGFDANQLGSIRGYFFENMLARLSGRESFTGRDRGRVDFESGFSQKLLTGLGITGLQAGFRTEVKASLENEYPKEVIKKFLDDNSSANSAMSRMAKLKGNNLINFRRIMGNIQGNKGLSPSDINFMNKFPSAFGMAKGGSVDTVPAMLEPGEFVINRRAASNLGLSTLNRMNQADKFATGGLVGYKHGGLHQSTTQAIDIYAGNIAGAVPNFGSASNITALTKMYEKQLTEAAREFAQLNEGTVMLNKRVKVMANLMETGTDKRQAYLTALSMNEEDLGGKNRPAAQAKLRAKIQNMSWGELISSGLGESKIGRFVTGLGESKIGRFAQGGVGLIGKGIKKVGGMGVVGMMGATAVSQALGEESAIGGGISGAMTGAAIGSMFGPWGTAIGGAIGAVNGFAESMKKSRINELNKQFADAMASGAEAQKEYNKQIELAAKGIPGAAQAAEKARVTQSTEYGRAMELAGHSAIRGARDSVSYGGGFKGAIRGGLFGVARFFGASQSVKQAKDALMTENDWQNAATNYMNATENQRGAIETGLMAKLDKQLRTGKGGLSLEDLSQSEIETLAYSGAEGKKTWAEVQRNKLYAETSGKAEYNEYATSIERNAAEKMLKLRKEELQSVINMDNKLRDLNIDTQIATLEFEKFGHSIEIISAKLKTVGLSFSGKSAYMNALFAGPGTLTERGDIGSYNMFRNAKAHTTDQLMSGFEKLGNIIGANKPALLQAKRYVKTGTEFGNTLDTILEQSLKDAKTGTLVGSLQKNIFESPAFKEAPDEIKDLVRKKISELFLNKNDVELRDLLTGKDSQGYKELRQLMETIRSQGLKLGEEITDQIIDVQQKMHNALKQQLALQLQINEKMGANASLVEENKNRLALMMDPSKTLTIAQKYAPVAARLGQYAGVAGIGAGDINNVAAIQQRMMALRKENDAIQDKLQKAKENQDVKTVTILESQEKQNQLAQVATQKMLETLHQDNTQLLAIEEEMAKIQRKKEAMTSSVLEIASMGPEALAQHNRQQRAKEAFLATGQFTSRQGMREAIAGMQWSIGGGRMTPEEAGNMQRQFAQGVAGSRWGRNVPGIAGFIEDQLSKPGASPVEKMLELQFKAAAQVQIDAGNASITLDRAVLNLTDAMMQTIFGGTISNIGAAVTRANGGLIGGSYSGIKDRVPAWLTEGEYVVRREAVPGNIDLLESLNNAPGFAKGGKMTWEQYEAGKAARRLAYERKAFRAYQNMNPPDLVERREKNRARIREAYKIRLNEDAERYWRGLGPSRNTVSRVGPENPKENVLYDANLINRLYGGPEAPAPSGLPIEQRGMAATDMGFIPEHVFNPAISLQRRTDDVIKRFAIPGTRKTPRGEYLDTLERMQALRDRGFNLGTAEGIEAYKQDVRARFAFPSPKTSTFRQRTPPRVMSAYATGGIVTGSTGAGGGNIEQVILNFANAINKLSSINIPSEIKIVGTVNTVVDLNGSAALASAIMQELLPKFNSMINNNISKVVDPNTGETFPSSLGQPLGGSYG